MPNSQVQVSVSLIEGRPATTSLKIAEHFGRRHCDVMRNIANLIEQCPEDFHKRNFALMSRKVKIGNGAEREEPYYTVFFDGFMLLVMGYTGKKALQMKLAYIAAFNAMREKLEKMELPPQTDDNTPITPADQNTLQAIVRAKVAQMPEALRRGGFPQIWSRFNNHFRLGSYKQLPQSRIVEAVAYLVAMPVGHASAVESKELPSPRQPLYRDGCFHLPRVNKERVAGPREKALRELWQNWSMRDQEIRLVFDQLVREIDELRGDAFSHAISDLGRNADSCFSIDAMCESFYHVRDSAVEHLRAALHDLRLHLRLSLSIAVMLNM